MKVVWQLITNKSKLRVQVLQSKYKCGNEALPETKVKVTDSHLWKGIATVCEKVIQNIRWHVGDGKSISFWFY